MSEFGSVKRIRVGEDAYRAVSLLAKLAAIRNDLIDIYNEDGIDAAELQHVMQCVQVWADRVEYKIRASDREPQGWPQNTLGDPDRSTGFLTLDFCIQEKDKPNG